MFPLCVYSFCFRSFFLFTTSKREFEALCVVCVCKTLASFFLRSPVSLRAATEESEKENLLIIMWRRFFNKRKWKEVRETRTMGKRKAYARASKQAKAALTLFLFIYRSFFSSFRFFFVRYRCLVSFPSFYYYFIFYSY